jgi:hypothetical protein
MMLLWSAADLPEFAQPLHQRVAVQIQYWWNN